MNRYLTTELSGRALIKRSFRLHYLTLKHTMLCIVAIIIIKYVTLILNSLIENSVAHIVFYIIAATAILYFFSVALLTTHQAFLDKPKLLLHTMKAIWKNKWPIAATFWMFVIGLLFLYAVIIFGIPLLSKLFHASASSAATGLPLFIALCLLFTYLSIFYFSFPLVIFDKKRILSSFYNSAILTEKNKLSVFFLFSILGLTLLLLTPGMIHEYLLSTYHLDIVFDFIVLCVVLPIYINLLLFAIHDSKLQLQ